MTLSRLLLASASPRRRELLSQAGVDFEVVVAEDAEPQRNPAEDCAAFACRAAVAKALAVARRCPGRLTLGADTIVVLDGQVLGKPADEVEAVAMLRRLSGRTHHVITGIAFVVGASGAASHAAHTESVTTEVTFRALTDEQIAEYVASGEPLDKAGAYGIQGLGGALVSAFQGSWSNVVGLPMEAVLAFLAQAGAAPRH